KRQQRQREAAENSREESAEEVLCSVIASVPESAAGAFLALSAFRSNAGNIINFPFLKEVAPVIAKTYPAEWASWRAKESSEGGHRWCADFLDRMAGSPFLEGDELTGAVRSRLAAKTVVKSETTDAA